MAEYRVSLDITREVYPVGTLNVFNNRGSEFYRFQYDDGWIDQPFAFDVDPMLPLKRKFPFQETRLWGVFQDISPDRWGQILQDRSSPNATPLPSGYMVGVSDSMRLGAIRISLLESPDEYLSRHSDVPKFVMLSELMEAIKRVELDLETSEDIRLLICPGASLGGDRPKAVVQDGREMWIAKFPSQKDKHRVTLWEFMMLKMADSVGIETPESKMLDLSGGTSYWSRGLIAV